MVVISIIAMLSSVILAGTTGIKAAARDSVRTQEVRQIDMAVQSYALSNGHPPDLQSNCSAGKILYPLTVKTCTALSTANQDTDPQGIAWKNFMLDLQPYISSKIPADPCGNSCTSSTDLPLGYTYISPAAVAYACSQSNTCGQLSADQFYWYQLYSALERNTYFMSTGSGGGALYNPNAPTAPGNLHVVQ